jgi:DNA helicase IV
MDGHRITPPRLIRWLRASSNWSLELSDESVGWERLGQRGSSPLVGSVEVVLVRGWLFTTIILITDGEMQTFDGAWGKRAKLFFTALNRGKKIARAKAAIVEATRVLDEASAALLVLGVDVESVIDADRYLAWRERNTLRQTIAEHQPLIKSTRAAIDAAVRLRIVVSPEVLRVLGLLETWSSEFEASAHKRNEGFVCNERAAWSKFFTVCETSPMTPEQVDAILTEEERTLLVAAAGSGKTSTVVAKVTYLLAKGIAKPEEILCLAFNKAAAREMDRRITDRLSSLVNGDAELPTEVRERLVGLRGRKVTSKTFHSFGLSVLIKAEGRRPKPWPKRGASPFEEALASCMRTRAFAQSWWQLQLVMGHEVPEASQFETEEDYQRYLRQVARERLQADGIKTLGTAKAVRSLQEAAISNWLYLMGVEFAYEASFVEGANVLCPGKTWTPDFSYRVKTGGTTATIIHEHFGLNARGEAPAFFKDPEEYAREARDKQDVLGQLDERHFWTTSADWTDGTLFDKLEGALRHAGIVFAPRSSEEIEAHMRHIGIEAKDDLVEAAVKQIRSNGFTQREVQERASELADRPRALLFADICWILAETVNTIIEQAGRVDYDEMIRRALKHLKARPSEVLFSRIIVDEFQDTAPGRGKVVQCLLSSAKMPRLLAVGDDWQAINRFSGSDLSFFTRFPQSFGLSKDAYAERRLETTFRTNQGIADIAGKFVLANKTQLKKRVNASDKQRAGVLDVRLFKDVDDIRGLIDSVLAAWVKAHQGPGEPSVFILSRYGLDYTQGIDETSMDEIDAAWAGKVKPPVGFASMFSSMHSSKGMQADYVLILGMYGLRHDYMCFPAQRYEDPLTGMFLPAKEAVEDAEERRLLYVALTRAKTSVAMIVHETHPSRYAVELIRAWPDGEVLLNGRPFTTCRECSEGVPVLRSRNGKTFWGCSNFRNHASWKAKASVA